MTKDWTVHELAIDGERRLMIWSWKLWKLQRILNNCQSTPQRWARNEGRRLTLSHKQHHVDDRLIDIKQWYKIHPPPVGHAHGQRGLRRSPLEYYHSPVSWLMDKIVRRWMRIRPWQRGLRRAKNEVVAVCDSQRRNDCRGFGVSKSRGLLGKNHCTFGSFKVAPLTR